MRKFIINISAYFIIIVILIIGSIIIYKHKINHLKFSGNISILICGDSHTECAINDSIIKNTINISNISEHYLYTYNVLKLILKNNTQIKTIILGCSFHSLGKNYDKVIYKNDKDLEMYSKYLPLLDNESILEILTKNQLDLIKSSVGIFSETINSIVKNFKTYQDYPFIGKYYSSKKNNLNDTTIRSAIIRHYYQKNGKIQDFYSFSQIKYLNKIVNLCLKKNIKLILINTPISNEYYKKIPSKFISNYYSTISGLSKRIEFWDFHSLKLENNCYGDGDHLNYVGANKFTLKIDSLINNHKFRCKL